ncbi:hypothetical protein ACG0Z6_09655 [Roseateles sp. BYS180W]|uniref:O-antigen ligase domain-containing protein n=1 Tax=Roseateles rivi TaxID=3299028 RepID=A0ABW7FW04_9BURK
MSSGKAFQEMFQGNNERRLVKIFRKLATGVGSISLPRGFSLRSISWREISWRSLIGKSLLVVFLLFSLLLIGSSTALMGTLAAVFWVGLAGVVVSYLYARFAGYTVFSVGLGLMLVMYFLAPLVFKVTGVNLVNKWQFYVMIFAVGGLGSGMRLLQQSQTFRWSMGALAVFLMLTLISTLFAGRSKYDAGLYQFLSNVKPVLIILVGFAVAEMKGSEGLVWRVVKTLWLPMLLLMVFQWGAPNLYSKVFKFPGVPPVEYFGIFPSRGMGIFEHPSFASTFGALMSLYCFAVARSDPDRKSQAVVFAVLYFIIMLGGGGRGELISYLFAAFCIALVGSKGRSLGQMFMIVLVVGIVSSVAYFVYKESFAEEALMWGASASGQIEHPRAQLYDGAIYIANKYWPLGSGLGTYGGAGSFNFDMSMYYELGFNSFWWFAAGENYIMDIYWHNSIAEAGWFGFCALLIHYLLLGFYAAGKFRAESDVRASALWALAFSGVVFNLLNSLTSPAFQDPRLFFFPAICIGLALKCSERGVAK